MSRILPPLNAVRAFEAAARHLSFTKAADELNVTQAAVSHQVKALETWFETPLFTRRKNGLFLTDAGQGFLPAARDALDGISSAARRVRSSEARRGLSISAQVSLASSWLIPNLPRFQERMPDVDVWLVANDSLTDFTRDPVDLAVRQGPGNYPGLDVAQILRERMFPVASARFLEEHGPVAQPEDLRGKRLIWDEYPMVAAEREGGRLLWRDWFATAGVSYVPTDGMAVSHANLAVQMAVEGRGVALTRSAVAASELAAGRLHRLFACSIAAPWAYYAVCPPAHLQRPAVAAFRDWLVEEGQRTMEQVDGPIEIR